MIGFTVPVKVWRGADEESATAMLVLDLDSVPDEEAPQLDLRLAGDGDVIVTCEVEDLREALSLIYAQFTEWRSGQGSAS